ncbi:hypothetical protein ACGH2B_28720 [Streptomyces sp. BBFR2]|uniref:hypothetical protein n=1 Tax=Streptomyces sp. BBFR2 TaxID=3372854 RepID=UPI0037D9A833
MADESLTPRQALHEAVALRDSVLERFLTLRAEVTRHAGAGLRRYLDDLGHGIRGNIEWGLRTPRYHVPHPAPTGAAPLDPHHWSQTPLTGAHDPRRLPTIAWWWQDLAR